MRPNSDGRNEKYRNTRRQPARLKFETTQSSEVIDQTLSKA